MERASSGSAGSAGPVAVAVVVVVVVAAAAEVGIEREVRLDTVAPEGWNNGSFSRNKSGNE